MKDIEEFTKAEEITNAISHGIGLLLAIGALVILIIFASTYGDTWHVVSFSIYGATLVILYLASTLYHSFKRGKVKDLFQIFDHSAIYLLIAGTYTPIVLNPLRGPLGWTLFGIVWGLALVGIVFKAFYVKKFVGISTLIYIVMGWLIIFAFSPLVNSVARISIIFLVAGGITYTVGSIFYVWPKIKYHHALWHLFVIGGSVCHFFAVIYLLPR
ncbi:PAQR family membrane homeostasis protein TrhA [Anaeromicrobium sediminis]|uniref:Hemolysin D n=1 Tax=Anaeromicrobium sediminis TaxID=1478221 RepID=A0A267MEH2_9FIRM|nr:hemolysin III family protein [Anaeromicrobium sediminis]PAB57974.1 hemolysin D [Anaeromicrobium sediminis]